MFTEGLASYIPQALNDKDRLFRPDGYMVSKLLEVFLTHELADNDEVRDRGMVVVCFGDPGFCESELLRGHPWIF